MPGRPTPSSQAPSVWVARQFDAIGEAWRTTSPAHTAFAASRSSGVAPTLPIWVAVITTICPAYDGSLTISW